MNTQKGPIDIRTLREFRCQWGFIYFANLGAVTSFPAKALGPRLEREIHFCRFGRAEVPVGTAVLHLVKSVPEHLIVGFLPVEQEIDGLPHFLSSIWR